MNFGSAVLVAGAITAVVAAPAGAQAPPSPATYAVTYLEITPAAKAEAINLIKQVGAASRKEPGNLRYEVLQRVDRSNQFAILEFWSDSKALEAHAGGAAMTEFRDKLKPLRSGPYDARPSVPISVAPVAAAAAKGSTYVLTHVDVTPSVKDNTIDMLKKLAEDGRKEPGSERFEAWQQNNRTNHFTVVEIWKNREAADAHAVTASTKEFREKLGPMIGALFDDRFYTSME
jgi:quinol monooxygenase YgiN